MVIRRTLPLLAALAFLSAGCGGGGGGTAPGGAAVTPPPAVEGADVHLTGQVLVAAAAGAPPADTAPGRAPAGFTVPAGATLALDGVDIPIRSDGTFEYRERRVAAGIRYFTLAEAGVILMRHPVELADRQRLFVNLFADLARGVGESTVTRLQDDAGGALVVRVLATQSTLDGRTLASATRSETRPADELVANVMARLNTLIAEAATELAGATRAVALTSSPALPATADLSYSDPLSSIALEPADLLLDEGRTRAMSAVASYRSGKIADLTGRGVLRTADPTVAVAEGGTLRAVAPGTTEARLRYLGLESPPARVVVRSPTIRRVLLSLDTAEALVLDRVGYHVTAELAGGATPEVTADAALLVAPADAARVDTGTVTLLKPGAVTLTASYGRVLSDPRTIAARNAATGIALALDASSCAVGGRVGFRVTASWRDGTTSDVTDAALVTLFGPQAVRDGRQLLGVIEGATTVSAAWGGFVSPVATLSVEPPSVAAVTLTLDATSLIAGGSTGYRVHATWSDGSSTDVTAQASLAISPVAGSGVLALDGGRLRALATGAADVTARYSGVASAAVRVTVSDNAVVALRLEPTLPAIPAGLATTYRVVAVRADGGESDATSAATVASSNAALAVAGGGTLRGIAEGAVTLVARLGGAESPAVAFTVTPAALASLTLALGAAALPAGRSTSLVVTATYTDGSALDVTLAAEVAPAPTTLAVRAGRQITAGAPGAGTLRARYGGIESPAVAFTALPPELVSLTLSSGVTSRPAGLTTPYTVSALWSDDTVTDVTSRALVAAEPPGVVAASGGTLRFLAPGGASLVARLEGGESPALRVTTLPKVLVALEWILPVSELPAGLSSAFALVGAWSTGETEEVTLRATYLTNTDRVAVVEGRVHAVSAGAATLVARLDGVESPAATFTVTSGVPAALTLAVPSTLPTPLGLTIPLSVVVTYTDGSTQEVGAAADLAFTPAGIVAIAPGLVGLATLAVGEVRVDATFAGLSAAPLTLAVGPKILHRLVFALDATSLPLGDPTTYTVTGVYTDGSTVGMTGAAQIEISPPGGITATAGAIATLAPGDYDLVAAAADLRSAPLRLTVTDKVPRELTFTLDTTAVPLGRSIVAAATLRYSDGSTSPVTPTWDFTPAGRFTVSGDRFTAVTVGTATLAAHHAGVSSAPRSIEALPAALEEISLSTSAVTLAAGFEREVTVTGRYSNGATADLAATAGAVVADPAVAAWNAGLLRGIAPGSTTVALSAEGVGPVTLAVTVTSATVTAVDFSLDAASGIQGTAIPFTCVARFSDGSTLDVSTLATYTAYPAESASFDGVGRLARLLAPGAVDLAARYGGVDSEPRRVDVSPLFLEVIVANRSSASLDLVLVLAAEAEAAARYGTGATPDTATGWSGAARVHLVTLANLPASTDVRFDLLGRLDGAEVVDDNGGAHRVARTARIGIGTSYLLTGRLLEGGLPAPGGVVTVVKAGADPLAVRPDADGYWFVNLANLKRADGGDPMPFAQGDAFTVRGITPSGGGETTIHPLTGTSPDRL